jgi:BolA protein
MNTDRASELERRLRAAFDTTSILVKDQSHLHHGHAGARDGKGHFDVRIVSDVFSGKSRLVRHRMVYEAVGSLMESDIHALHITALSVAESK